MKRTKIITFKSFLLSLTFAGALTGCTGKHDVNQADVLTQIPVSDSRQTITVLVKNAFTINGFERAVEEKFPDINLIQVGNYSHEIGVDEYSARLEHDDLPDIIMTWPLDVGEEFWQDRLLDLSGMDFTNRYNLSMLNEISKDGKLYYLPGPAQVRGLVYNKTLFDENGWQVPEDFEGFVQLCKTIEDSGIRSLQLGLGNPEVLDTAFVGFGFADCFSKPQDSLWISEYNSGKHSFGDHFSPALDTFQRLIDEGILKKSDIDIQYAKRETMLFTRQCAMVEDSVLLARMGYSQTGTTDQFALMPFFNPGEESQWARLYMVCYIGLNKHLAEPSNKETYDTVLKLMDYISTSAGQQALMSDTGAMFSSLTELGAPDVPEIHEILPALQQGHYGVFPTLTYAQSALRQGLSGMVTGELTKDDVITMVDAENYNPPDPPRPVLLGNATEDFSLTDTGSYVTDAMRKASGCEIALFMDNGKDGKSSGKGLNGRLYQGEVTQTDIDRIFPDLKHDDQGVLWKITMTGEDLIRTLDYSISINHNITGWFYYVSGLSIDFAPCAELGNRVRRIALEDGRAVQPTELYTIAVMDGTVPEEFIQSCEKTDIRILDIISNQVKADGTITPAKDGRFKVVKP